MPAAMPPCCWPSTSNGLSTCRSRRRRRGARSVTLPVSRSTSTTAMCAPNGNVASPGPSRPRGVRPTCRRRDDIRPASAASGQLAPAERLARHAGATAPAAVDDDVGDAASSTSAARLPGLLDHRRHASWMEDPPTCIEREPPVPPPRAPRRVAIDDPDRSKGIPVCSRRSSRRSGGPGRARTCRPAP